MVFWENQKIWFLLLSSIHLQQVLFSSVISQLNYILSGERRGYYIYKQKYQMKNDFLIAIIFKGVSLLIRVLQKKNVCVCVCVASQVVLRHKKCRFNSWVRKSPWKRAWQPTPVFLPGEPHGQRSLAGYIHSIGSHRVEHDCCNLAWHGMAHSGPAQFSRSG